MKFIKELLFEMPYKAEPELDDFDGDVSGLVEAGFAVKAWDTDTGVGDGGVHASHLHGYWLYDGWEEADKTLGDNFRRTIGGDRLSDMTVDPSVKARIEKKSQPKQLPFATSKKIVATVVESSGEYQNNGPYIYVGHKVTADQARRWYVAAVSEEDDDL